MKNILKKIIAYTLRIESQLVLWKYKPKIIAITGSVGKTSTKDAVYAVLSEVSHVRKSEKSYNSEIGLPLSILGLPNGWNNPWVWFINILKGFWLFLGPHQYPKWLILEVGIGKPNDLYYTASWLKTDVVIITAIGETPAHIEFFASRKHLIEEKTSLIKTLKKDGFLILNADDTDVLEMQTKTKNIVFTYGFTAGANIFGSDDNILYDDDGIPKGVIFRVNVEGSSLPVVIEGVFGRNHVYASLAALALSFALKLNMLNATNALKNYEVAPGRMKLLKGINDSMIIDDTYNSSPFSCESALKTLGGVKTGPSTMLGVNRKIAILGDMLQLGKHTEEAHKSIGRITKENCNILIVVGPRAQAIKSGAIEAGMNQENVFEFLDSPQAGEFVKTFVQAGDLVLVKGSQGMRMERVCEAVILDKANKNKLLVRQGKEWLRKR